MAQWLALGAAGAALALPAGGAAAPHQAHGARGPCAADQARKHARASLALEERSEEQERLGHPTAARALRRRVHWQSELARYYEELGTRHALPRGAAITLRTLRRSRALRRSFLVGFEGLTPENEMKMERLQPAPGVFRFAEADRMVRFARRYCKRIRGHTLVYGKQLPRWATDGRFDSERLGSEMDWHIRTVMAHFEDSVHEWDVVNEAVAPDGGYTQNVWFRALGKNYVERAFRTAHDTDPGATLFYNDSGIELPDHPHTVAVRKMVADLRHRGVPIQGVGIQNHVSLGHHATRAELARTIRGFTRLGVKVAITEMDVRLDGPGSLARKLEAQRRVYRDAARACRANPGCTSFSTWGVGDRVSWLGAAARGLLLDRGYHPKPAYNAVSRSLGSPLAPDTPNNEPGRPLPRAPRL
jgi:endo-1,4-beta-xylanase